MRRIRLSTWVLTAIFLAALVAYVLVKPSSESIVCSEQGQHTPSTSPATGTLPPGVIPRTSPHSSPGDRAPASRPEPCWRGRQAFGLSRP
jgi:hypothetical protein